MGARAPSVLSAACAVAWLSDASPKLQTTIASLGQAHSTPSLPGPVDRERDADCARQVRGDRRRLRDHGQLVMTEDLVPPAGDRLVGRGGHPEQDVRHAVATDLSGAGEVEARPSGSGAAPDRSGGARARRRRCSRGPPSRSCRSCGPPSAATAPRGRSGGSSTCACQSASASAARPRPAAPAARARRALRGGAARADRDRPPWSSGGAAPQPKKTNGRTTSESIASSHTTAPPGSTSPCSRAASASASSRVSAPTIRCDHWRTGW